jgi:hypothetical protein
LCKKKRIGKQAQNCNAKGAAQKECIEREREREKDNRLVAKLKKLER